MVIHDRTDKACHGAPTPGEGREDREFMEGEDDVREERGEYEEADKLLVDLLA